MAVGAPRQAEQSARPEIALLLTTTPLMQGGNQAALHSQAGTVAEGAPGRFGVTVGSRLRWEAITWANGRNGTLLVTHGKTKAARRVLPFTPRVRAVLQTRWEKAGRPEEGWVWPATAKSGHVEPCSLKRQHRKALRFSGVRPFVLYSLRHTFLTRLGESGCDAWTLARIAGHSSIGISARSVHPSEDAVLIAVDRLGGHRSGHSREEPMEAARQENVLTAAHSES